MQKVLPAIASVSETILKGHRVEDLVVRSETTRVPQTVVALLQRPEAG